MSLLNKISDMFTTSADAGELYQDLLDKAATHLTKDLVKSTQYVKMASSLAWISNTSLKHDKNLDDIVHKIGELNKVAAQPDANEGEVIFVVSGIVPFSGLTQLVDNLIKHFPKEQDITIWSTEAFSHSNVSSDQANAMRSYAQIHAIDKDEDDLSNAKRIASWAMKRPVKSILYLLSPNDVIGVLLASMLPDLNNILVNVSHHVYSLGSLQFDSVVDISDYYYDETMHQKRNPNTVLIYQSGRQEFDELGKIKEIDVRAHLKIPEDTLLTVTVGNPKKNLWNNDQSYIEIIGEMLKKHAQVHHILIAKGMHEIRSMIVDKFPEVSDRVHVVEGTNNLIAALKSCDIYLNSFPVGGALSSLDAIASGLPIVSIPAQSKWFKIPEITAFNKDEYLDVITWYIEDEEFRNEQIKSLQQFYIANHNPSVVAENFIKLINKKLSHDQKFGETTDFKIIDVKKHIHHKRFEREIVKPYEALGNKINANIKRIQKVLL